MSIVRKPGTNLPQISGTSIAGVCRTYGAMQENCYRWEADGKTYVCAGQGQEDKDKNIAGHCGKPDCSISVTFGFSMSDGSYLALIRLFSPVVWREESSWATCC